MSLVSDTGRVTSRRCIETDTRAESAQAIGDEAHVTLVAKPKSTSYYI
jgi:hypothetical protein